MSRLLPKSMRTRLAISHALALALALAAYSLILYAMFHRSLYGELDVKLRNDLESADDGSLPRDPENWLTEVWTTNGERISTSGAAGDQPLGPLDSFCVSRHAPYDAVAETGIAVRVFCQESAIKRGTQVLRVARVKERADAHLQEFRVVTLLGAPVVVLLSIVFGFFLARRALDPVAKMTSAARRLSANRLGDRLPVVNPDDELGHLAQTFNNVFRDLERSFHQMRRFSADAAHELRTPLTAIRAVGEVALRQRDTGAARNHADTIESILEEVDRLSRLCDSLLLLSRADAGQVLLQLEIVRLRPIVDAVVDLLTILADEKGQRINLKAANDPQARVDHRFLKQAITNLVDNAIRHAPPGSEIGVELATLGGQAKIAVSDNGPGIAPEHQQLVFERFYRIDPARSRADGRGAGLGLAITRWIVELHGGRVTLHSEPGRGARFEIELPPAGT